MNEIDRKKHTATSRLDTSSLPRGPLNWVFFPAALLYHELLLRAFDRQSTFFTGTLVLVVLFGILVTATNWGKWQVIAGVWVIAGLCIYRHHANIGRLIHGTERKIGQKA